jgi:hypothetical protein
MTVKEANTIPLVDLLHKLGLEPTDAPDVGNDVWYKSPFNASEKATNLHVDKRRNVWYDFGLQQGGRNLDFIILYNNCDETTALAVISDFFSKSKVFKKQDTSNVKKEVFSLKEVKPLQHPMLIAFLQDELKIKQPIAKKFLIEVAFVHNQDKKDYFAIAMKNEAEGYAIKNKYFEGFLGRKDITILRGVSPTLNSVSVFMDIPDFLAAADYYGDILTHHDVIIMHHTEFFEKTLRLTQVKKYSHVFTYFPNDAVGEGYAYAFQDVFTIHHEPCHGFYYPQLSFSAYWQKVKKLRG